MAQLVNNSQCTYRNSLPYPPLFVLLLTQKFPLSFLSFSLLLISFTLVFKAVDTPFSLLLYPSRSLTVYIVFLFWFSECIFAFLSYLATIDTVKEVRGALSLLLLYRGSSEREKREKREKYLRQQFTARQGKDRSLKREWVVIRDCEEQKEGVLIGQAGYTFSRSRKEGMSKSSVQILQSPPGIPPHSQASSTSCAANS